MDNSINRLRLNPEFIHSDMKVSALMSFVRSQVTPRLFGSNAETSDPKVEMTFLVCLDLLKAFCGFEGTHLKRQEGI